MNSIEDYLFYIIPEVPGATESLVKTYTRMALRDFCRETEIWTEEIETIDMVADQASYAIPVTGDAYIKRLEWVKRKTSTDNLFEDITKSSEDTYKLVGDKTLEFVRQENIPTLTITDGIAVKIAKMPRISCEVLSDNLFDRYGEAVINRAKKLLMDLPKKPWSNPARAMECQREYERYKADAYREKHAENKSGTVHVQQRGALI
jgi:hypothetical protein